MYKTGFKLGIVIYCGWQLLKLIPTRFWESLENKCVEYASYRLSRLIFEEK